MRIDLPGYGKSQPAIKVESLKDFSRSIKDFITNQLKYSEETIAEKLILVGWSLGGAIAFQTAALWPQLFKRFITICSCPIVGNQILQDDEVLILFDIQNGQPLTVFCETKEQLAKTKIWGGMQFLIDTQNKEVFKAIYS